MAIYHLTVKAISRSKGKSAVASSAYRRAAQLFDERAQKTWNYYNKPDVIYSEIFIPAHVPDWAKNLLALQNDNPNLAAELLWNKVEQSEKRKDAQLAREVEFAIPIELNEAQAKNLISEFVHDQFVSLGMIADVNMHWDEGNPHVHVMLTLRTLTEDGFGLKQREWNSKERLQTWREKWAEYANFHLYMNQKEVRIDHRSYHDQGISLIPTIHYGKAVSDMTSRGIQTAIMQDANSIRQENLARIAANPTLLFDKLTSQSSTFSETQVGHELGRYLNDQGQFSYHEKQQSSTLATFDTTPQPQLTPVAIADILALLEQHEAVFTEREITKKLSLYTQNAQQLTQALSSIKASPELLFLGAGDDGRDRYTTRHMFNVENTIQAIVDAERQRKHVKISDARINNILATYQQRLGKRLSDEKLMAVKHIVNSSAIACLVGRAGTGKSFSIGAAKVIWESEGLQVLGVALSGIAADGLAKDSGIDSRTIDAFRYAIEKEQIALTSRHVVVMDEAGMTDSASMLVVLNEVKKAKAKLVLVGDPAQLQPVGPGATFRALLERLGHVEIQTVYRQREDWQREATVAFSSGNIAEGLAAYDAQGCIHLENSQDDAFARLKTDWFAACETTAIDKLLVITHRNEDVQALNSLLRKERIARSELAEGYTVRSTQGTIKIASGDRLLFLKNNHHLGVSNGRFATVKYVNFTESGRVINFTVILDGTEKEISINPETYSHFTYGYAATVHKIQGMTVDRSFVYAGGTGWDRHLTYVALSRHRKSCQLYTDKTAFQNQASLYKRLGRFGLKDSVLDFPLKFAERRGLQTGILLSLLPTHLAVRLQHLKTHVFNRFLQWSNPERYATELHARAEQQYEQEIKANQREDARLVAYYVDANQDVGRCFQALNEKMQAMGLKEIDIANRELITGSKVYQQFQAALIERNRQAAILMQAPFRYQQAFDIYGLELAKLQNQAEQYNRYQQVETYQAYDAVGKIIHRDKLALTLMRSIKNYYPLLKNAGIDSALIRKQAIAHLRRQRFKHLSSQEKQAFRIVERYQALHQQVGKTYHALAKREDITPLETLTHARDSLAAMIVSERLRYDKALDFYQIGLATPLFGNKPTEAELKRSEQRWATLMQQAARHITRTRVQAYQQAESDVMRRLQLAYEIVKDAKRHHGAIVNLGANTQAIWRAIRKDAKQFERYQQYKTLSMKEKIGFRTVERYVEAKQAHGTAWRELFETKKALQLTDEALYQQLARFAAPYTRLRNQLAADILAHPDWHQADLRYFGITVDDLQPQAFVHHCQQIVEQYVNSQDTLTRAELAKQIVTHPKAYAGSVKAQGLSWKVLYMDARIAERRQHFTCLSSSERALYRLAARYKKAHQAVGRGYGRNAPKTALNWLAAKRDYLAWRLVNSAQVLDESLLPVVAENNRLNIDKLQRQAGQHQYRLEKVEHWQAALQAVAATLDDTSKVLPAILFAEQFAKRYGFEKYSDSYRYAFLHAGLTLQPYLQSLSTLRQNIKQTAKVDINQAEHLVTKRIQSVASGTSYQKLDIQALRQDLNAMAEEVVYHYLGTPKHRQGATLRYGTHQGSLVITIHGVRQGLWHDFQEQVGGDMLRLIQYALKTDDFKVALEEAMRFLGGASQYAVSSTQSVRTVSQPKIPDTRNIRIAQKIYQETQPLEGTLAERYLQEHRKIVGNINPDTFRYHPHLKNWKNGQYYPALIVASRDAEQAVCGIQEIFLDSATANKAAIGHIAKLSRGKTSEGACIQQGEGRVALAEGPETGLSVACAHPDWTVYVTFGVSNFTKVALKTQQTCITICADNDGPDSGTAKSVARAAQALSEKGVDVWVALPEKAEGQAKWDFNDALQHQGFDQIRKDLDKAYLYKSGITQAQRDGAIEQAKRLLQPEDNPLQALSLESLLLQYVEMELKQTELMTAKLEVLSTHQEQRTLITKQIGRHTKALQAFAAQAIKHPEVKHALEQLKEIKTPSLAKQGGFAAIYERLLLKTWTQQDKQVLIMQLRVKALQQSHAQNHERDRGGRTR